MEHFSTDSFHNTDAGGHVVEGDDSMKSAAKLGRAGISFKGPEYDNQSASLGIKQHSVAETQQT